MATKVFTAAEIDFSSATGPAVNWAAVAAAWAVSMNGDSGVVVNDLASAGGDQVLGIIGIPHDDGSLPAVIVMSNVNIEFDWAITNTTVAAGNVSWIESDSNGANKQYQTAGASTGHSSGDYDPATYLGGTDRAALFSAGAVWTYWWEDEATGRVSGRVAVTNYTVTVTYTATVTAAVTSVRPASGSVLGSQAVTVRGIGFNVATGVTFDGAAATSVVIVSDTTITCVTPAHRSGVVDIVVAGVGTGAQLYTYALTSVVSLPPVPIRSAVASSGLPASPRDGGSASETPMDLAYQRWLMHAKQVLENLPTRSIGAEQVIGAFTVDQIPDLPWVKILKAGSSLGDLEFRDANDINLGILRVSHGGTGLDSYAIGDLLYASATATLTALADVAAGSYLRSGGVATAPLWSTLTLPNAATSGDILVASAANVMAAQAPAALTRTNDTNVTLTLGGSATTALVNAASLTLGWTGTLSVARGGTGTGTALTTGSVVFAGASGVLSQDNANLFWDDSNNRLGVGTASPTARLDVTQSSSPAADTTLVNESATWNAGTVTSTRNLSGQALTVTPTANVTESGGVDGILTIGAAAKVVNLAGLTMGDNPSGNPTIVVSGDSMSITGNSVFNNPTATGVGNSWSVYGYRASIITSPTVTAIGGSDRIGYYAGSYDVSVTSATLPADVRGFTASASGNLPAGTHVGASFIVGGTAVSNTGFAVSASGATSNIGLSISNPPAAAANYAIYSTAGAQSYLAGALQLGGKATLYNNIVTAGWGVPAVYAAARSTAQTAAVASVATYTLGAADATVTVSANVNVTVSTTHSFAVQADYTDETNTARTATLPLAQLAGTFVAAVTNLTGAGPYEGVPLHLRCKASTTITIKTTGTFTVVTYNVDGLIAQAA